MFHKQILNKGLMVRKYSFNEITLVKSKRMGAYSNSAAYSIGALIAIIWVWTLKRDWTRIENS